MPIYTHVYLTESLVALPFIPYCLRAISPRPSYDRQYCFCYGFWQSHPYIIITATVSQWRSRRILRVFSGICILFYFRHYHRVDGIIHYAFQSFHLRVYYVMYYVWWTDWTASNHSVLFCTSITPYVILLNLILLFPFPSHSKSEGQTHDNSFTG